MGESSGEVENDQLLSPRRAAARLLKSPLPAPGSVQPNALHFLGSNDDQLERAQARAARAAALRRKPVAAAAQGTANGPKSDVLGKEQIMDLFHNCIKLASENKINQKNTWDLNLIDHLSEIIKVESDDDAETNFQKASCTLEAGVKIYSMRVDSVHSEAYKVLGGINRAGRDDEKENEPEVDNVDNSQEGIQKKGTDKKLSPLWTLESSYEALNVKKFDVAFTVDPLYHQTSARIDEGGAKGLLLNNLGVYGVCQVLFDSLESPTNVMSAKLDDGSPDTIDLSFAKDCIMEMMASIDTKEISPTLKEIVKLFNEDNQRPTDVYPAAEISDVLNSTCESTENFLEGNQNGFEKEENMFDSNKNDFENNIPGEYEPCDSDHDELGSVVDDCSTYTAANFAGDRKENSSCAIFEHHAHTLVENIAEFLAQGVGIASKTNAWAGPDHWKYRKIKVPDEDPASVGESPLIKSRVKKKRQEACDIDFTKALDTEFPDIFAPPKNRRSILLPRNRGPCNVTLPEDCHYQAENLVKLFLRPEVMCLGKNKKKSAGEPMQPNEAMPPSWDDDESGVNDYYDDDENVVADLEGLGTLVSKPRQVNEIEVQFDKSSKQVDVHALKETLWSVIQESNLPAEKPAEEEEAVDEGVSFRQVLGCFAKKAGDGGKAKDVSPHLSFICLLHLANEHGLSLRGTPSLDNLHICLPSS